MEFLLSFQRSLLHVHVLLLVIVDLFLLYILFKICRAVCIIWLCRHDFLHRFRGDINAKKRQITLMPLLVRKGLISQNKKFKSHEWTMLAQVLKNNGLSSKEDLEKLPDGWGNDPNNWKYQIFK